MLINGNRKQIALRGDKLGHVKVHIHLTECQPNLIDTNYLLSCKKTPKICITKLSILKVLI